jgi:hypothetical protein
MLPVRAPGKKNRPASDVIPADAARKSAVLRALRASA